MIKKSKKTSYKISFKKMALIASLGTLLASPAFAQVELTGINLSAAGFGGSVLPGTHNTNYHYPEEKYFQEWSARGIKLVRFPFLWERMQNSVYAELNKDEVARMDQVLKYAQKYNMKVILDIHNYGRYYNKLIGVTTPATYEAYADFVKKLVKQFNNYPAIYGWDIMNEPHDPQVGNWFPMAQAGINAVRTYDSNRYIFIEGDNWANAATWNIYNDSLRNLRDPANKLVFEAHIYFDSTAGGQYAGQDMSKFDTNIGVQRARPFVEWLQKYNLKGYIGEYGAPGNDQRWLTAMDTFLSYLKQHCIPSTYWSAGPWWGNDHLAIEPINGQARPQWSVVSKYVGNTCTDFGPKAGVGSSPSVPTPTQPTQPTNPTPNPTIPVAGTTAVFNNVSNGDWVRGVATGAAGFSIPNNSTNQAAFTAGKYVTFANGEVRQIKQVYAFSQYYNVYVSGNVLNGNVVGYPNTVSVSSSASGNNNNNNNNNSNSNSNGSGNTGAGTNLVSSGYNNVTNGDWLKGVARNAAGFSIPNTAANQAKFTKGKTVTFSNGEKRTISQIYVNGQYYNVYLNGSPLNGDVVGYPNSVSTQ